MLLAKYFLCVVGLFATALAAPRPTSPGVQGIRDLIQRRLPHLAGKFDLILVNATTVDQTKERDWYTISSVRNGNIQVEGNSLSALSYGVGRYLSSHANVSLFWNLESTLDQVSTHLPVLSEPLHGESLVPFRYMFNTVTFSYTMTFWDWAQWEDQLDWMAFNGVNLALAWNGYEKIFIEVYKELGLTDAEIANFLSGPSFLAWNRFGNIQGFWEGDLPMVWVEGQFELQKKIIKRMIDLGIIPILPAITSFVPRALTRLYPNADVVNAAQWNGFPATQFTDDTFLSPTDPLYAQLQKSFIQKQIIAYGNVTVFYTLDQFNEIDPHSGDLEFLRNISATTWRSLKDANPAAVMVMQAWLFFSSQAFWTNDRIEAYLGGVENNQDMLLLDLFSESQPQWLRTNSYFGKPFIWCHLHDYGQNMGIYGQVENVTVNAVEAWRNESSTLVGYGLTMEGQEGNEIMYDLTLDQAWSEEPIDTQIYFADWVSKRYSASQNDIPGDVYRAWDLLRTSAFNNTNLTSNAVSKAIFELVPSITGLVNRTGHHPTTVNYDPAIMVEAWRLMFNAASTKASDLFHVEAFQYDMIDFTRQVVSNSFIGLYEDLVNVWKLYTNGQASSQDIKTAGRKLSDILSFLDPVLDTHQFYRLSTWIEAARAWAGSNNTLANYYEYNVRNQNTLWGPTGQISDYASKSWSGLISGYYIPRWNMFVDYLVDTKIQTQYNQTVFVQELLKFEEAWQLETTKSHSKPMDNLKQRGDKLRMLLDDGEKKFIV